MIKLENTEVVGWEAVIRGMRNPMNSWEKSDSRYSCLCMDDKRDCPVEPYIIGPSDLELMMKLRNAGTDHRKFMRMIVVYVDITAPLYWWKEFDTYKVGTVANSCSTMHKIADKEFTLDDFSHEHLIADEEHPIYSAFNDERLDGGGLLGLTINFLNYWRNKYLKAKTNPMKDESKRAGLMKQYWWQMIQMLPSSYNQKRTVMLNYEVLANIYKSRKNHKLDEWVEFCKWIEGLPYSELITGVSLKGIPICNEIMEEAKRRVTAEENKDNEC